MTSEEVLQAIRDLVFDQLGFEPENVTMDASFEDDLWADADGMAQLAEAMEEEFDISPITAEELEGLKTVGDAVHFVLEKVNK